MTYLNQVIKRTCPMTPAQCAVMAVITTSWASPHDIWICNPRFRVRKATSSFSPVRTVAYGTISTILRGLVQQGFVERKVLSGNKVFYRRVTE